MAMSVPGHAQASRLEFAVVAAIALSFLGINLATSSRFPVVWADEAYFAEPAVNTNLGLGFTSYANAIQPHGHFWAGNMPLYSMLLTGWLKVFGIGVVEARSFGYVLSALAIFPIWWATIRLRLITSPKMRVAFLLTMLLAYGPGLCYRNVRYDSLSMLLVSLALLAASIGSIGLRLALLVALGAIFTMTQLSLVTSAAQIALVLLCFYGRKYFLEVMALGVGTILGGGLLYVLLNSQGVWPDMVAFVQRQRTIDSGGIPKDPSFPFIVVAAFCLALDRFCRGQLRWRSPLVFGLAAGLFVPLGQLAIGWFPTNYTWMAIGPLAIGIFSEFSDAGLAIGLPGRAAATAALAASCLVGMPLQLTSAVSFWKERDYNRVISLVHEHVGSSDWVYCDPGAYYAAKTTAELVFLNGYDVHDRFFTPEEKARISVMVIAPWEFETACKRLGGAWVAAGAPVSPPDRGFLFFRVNFGDKLVMNYNLQAYRRVGDRATRPSVASRGSGPGRVD